MSEKKSNKKWFSILLNKYLIVGLAFLVWMIFFDQNSYLMHNNLDEDIRELKEEKQYFEKEIEVEGSELKRLENQPEEYEKLAREKYLMKRENEDIFVIEKKDTIINE